MSDFLGTQIKAQGERVRAFIRTNPSARRYARKMIRTLSGALAEGHKRYQSYDGARPSTRSEGWTGNSLGANAALNGSLVALRNRSRDLERNDPHGHRFIYVMANNIMGQGPLPSAATGDKELDAYCNALWKRHSKRLNADGTPYGAQAIMWQAAANTALSGECLLLRRPCPSSDKLPAPVQVELLESDMLNHLRNGATKDGGTITNGVEQDARRRIVAYHLLKAHPGESYLGSAVCGDVRIDASDISHCYVALRPGQRRGVPWMAPSLHRLRGLTDYRDTEGLRKKIEASMCAFVFGEDDDAPAGLTSQVTDAHGNPVETFEPGLIAYIKGGREIKFNAPSASGGYAEYVTSELQSIAASLMLPYHIFTGDTSKANYSSMRADLLELHRFIRVVRELFFLPTIPQAMWDWTFAADYMMGNIPTPDIPCTWACQKFESIDPLKEAQANMLCFKAGTRTWSDVVSEMGRDPDDVAYEMAADNERFQDLKIDYLEWQAKQKAASQADAAAMADDDTDPDEDPDKDGGPNA